MKEISTTNSQEKILVDDEDYSRVSMWKWHVCGHTRETIRRTLPPQLTLANFILNSYDLMYDHKNGNPYDFRKENLRPATQQQNMMNKRKQDFFYGTSSKYKGVSWHKENKCWRVRIYKNGKKHEIGCFTDELNAAKAYNDAALKYHGEFARLNEIKDI